MQVNTENTLAVVQKLFGKTHEEASKQLYPGTQLEKSARYIWGVHVDQVTGAGAQISMGFHGYVHLIQFTLTPYPACCGSTLFHTFRVDESKVSQEQLDEVMNAFIAENKAAALGYNNRIEVVMVERRLDRNNDYVHRSVMDEPVPVENPNMKYKSLWNFFHKYGKRVRTRMEVNINTNNVLHNMEVIL